MNEINTYKNIDLGNFDFFLSQSFYLLKEKLKDIEFNKICIITDEHVKSLYLEDLEKSLSIYDVYSFSFMQGENNKNLSTVEKAYEFLLENNFNRNDIIIALGGGVVGDTAGFIASTYMRGIPFINCPTTFISLIDSSIGGKTGVDFLKYKNIIGSFHNPLFIYANISCLKTLDERQIHTGLSEVIKYSLCFSREFFDFLFKNSKAIMNLDPECLEKIIENCVTYKNKIVQEDPFDKGKRAILNFGHTIGHAIEKCSNYAYTHGEAVAIGIVSATLISKELGYIEEKEVNLIKSILTFYNLPIKFRDDIEIKDILYAIKKDKKHYTKGLLYIILKSIGEADIITISNDDNIIEKVLNLQKEL